MKEILREHNRAEVLRAHGLRPSDRVLFCGPPGCGKTLTAEVIANELGRPLAIVRADSVVSSFLGETAANLRKVFDFVSACPMVALFDEFDALGKEREDASEHGELRRVVNAVLQMLDFYQGRSLVIAATNHEGMLDTAIWRRFEEVLFLEPPTVTQLRRLLNIKLRGVRREFSIDDVTGRGWFKGATHADVERTLRRAVIEPVPEAIAFKAVNCACVSNTWKQRGAASARDNIGQGIADPCPCRRWMTAGRTSSCGGKSQWSSAGRAMVSVVYPRRRIPRGTARFLVSGCRRRGKMPKPMSAAMTSGFSSSSRSTKGYGRRT